MLSLVRPRSFIPVHGTYRHLVRHAKLANEMGVADTLVMLNGDCVELSERDVRVVDQWPVGRAHVQGGKPVSDQALRDRSLLAEVGIAVVSIHVSDNGDIVSTPSLMTRGLFVEDNHRHVTDEAIAEVEDALERVSPGANNETLQRSACNALRKTLGAHLGYRPSVYALLTRTRA